MANAADVYYAMSWGSIRLWSSSVQTDNGRTKAVKELSRGDVAPVQDRGLKTRRTRVSLLFDEMMGESTTGIRRFRILKAAVDSGEPALFSHPIDGSYIAGVGEFDYVIDEHGVIQSCTIEFIAEEEVRPISPAGAGTSASTGEGSVSQASDDLDAALAKVGAPTTTITATATAAQDAWTSTDTVSARKITIDTANLVDQIGNLIDAGGFEGDLALWDCYRSSIMLGDALRTAALAATAELANVFVMKIGAPISLLALVVKIYGGRDADDRMRQIQSLNDIKTVGWLEPGFELLAPSPSTSPRATL